eukprot:scaffold72325_cov28-Phaeocystis_antarctica.AAC.2
MVYCSAYLGCTNTYQVRVIDLFREWDEDGNGTVSKKEFRKAMPMLGLQLLVEEVDGLYDSWDPDGSGVF